MKMSDIFYDYNLIGVGIASKVCNSFTDLDDVIWSIYLFIKKKKIPSLITTFLSLLICRVRHHYEHLTYFYNFLPLK